MHPEPPPNAPNGAASTPSRKQPAAHIPASPPPAPEMPNIEPVDVRIDNVFDVEPAPPPFIIDELVPCNVVTLLSGNGGVGKSMLALLIAICVAMGISFLGKPTKKSKVLYFSAEDPADILLHKLMKICRLLGVDPIALARNLTIQDATDMDPTLFREVSEHGVRDCITTPAYAVLRQYIDERGIQFLVVDNASDTFGANENTRRDVRAFVRALVHLVKRRGGACLLAAHVDKQTAKGSGGGTQSYSGSTQWHNSTRSRLVMLETDQGVTLKHEKSNYGLKAKPLNLQWNSDGVLTLADNTNAGSFLNTFIPASDTAAILHMVGEFSERGEFIGVAPNSPDNAYKKLCEEIGFPETMTRDRLTALMRKAERDGQIVREEYRTAARKFKERWTLTAKGKELL